MLFRIPLPASYRPDKNASDYFRELYNKRKLSNDVSNAIHNIKEEREKTDDTQYLIDCRALDPFYINDSTHQLEVLQ
jgi:hypothetical protein